jgi:regulation of enolase protein 1 (concanavalin A-like superfamily)
LALDVAVGGVDDQRNQKQAGKQQWRRWAKLCVERSPIGETSIVSVVTNEWSDDANNALLPSPEAYLRITKIAGLVGMHYSLAGDAWRFVRAFGVDWPSPVLAGVQAQAPVQAGCPVFFADFRFSKDVVTDCRSAQSLQFRHPARGTSWLA